MHENSPNRKNAIQYASRNNNNLLQCRQREAASLLPLATKVENTDRGQFWACPSMIPKVSLPWGIQAPCLLVPLETIPSKRHLDRFIRVCMAHSRNQQTDTEITLQ